MRDVSIGVFRRTGKTGLGVRQGAGNIPSQGNEGRQGRRAEVSITSPPVVGEGAGSPVETV